MSAPAPPEGGRRLAADEPFRALLRRAAASPGEYAIFALLRMVEARAPDRPRVGRSRLPAQDLVALAQAPTLAFPATTLADVSPDPDRPRIRGYYLGLTGPMAPMPLHVTEIAYDEERYGRERPFGAMLDLLAARMLQFFFRAWADSQPAAHADRPDDDRFAEYVAAVSGAMQGAHTDSAFPGAARLQYAGLFVGRRSVGSIEDALSHLLATPVAVHPFQPRWRAVAPEDRSRLSRTAGFATLGQDAVAGGRVRQVADAYRVVIRAKSLREYETLLPGGARYALAVDALEAFAPSHLDWLIELELAEDAAPRARLGGGTALGWTGWLGSASSRPSRGGYRADTRLRRTRTDRSGLEQAPGAHR